MKNAKEVEFDRNYDKASQQLMLYSIFFNALIYYTLQCVGNTEIYVLAPEDAILI